MEYNYTRPYISETTNIFLLENFTSDLEKFNTTPTSEMDLSDNGKYNGYGVWKVIDISKNEIKISAVFVYLWYATLTSVWLQIYLNARGPFYWDGSTLVHEWVSNHMSSKVGCFKIRKFWFALSLFTHLWCMPKDAWQISAKSVWVCPPTQPPPSCIFPYWPGGLKKRHIDYT